MLLQYNSVRIESRSTSLNIRSVLIGPASPHVRDVVAQQSRKKVRPSGCLTVESRQDCQPGGHVFRFSTRIQTYAVVVTAVPQSDAHLFCTWGSLNNNNSIARHRVSTILSKSAIQQAGLLGKGIGLDKRGFFMLDIHLCHTLHGPNGLALLIQCPTAPCIKCHVKVRWKTGRL